MYMQDAMLGLYAWVALHLLPYPRSAFGSPTGFFLYPLFSFLFVYVPEDPPFSHVSFSCSPQSSFRNTIRMYQTLSRRRPSSSARILRCCCCITVAAAAVRSLHLPCQASRGHRHTLREDLIFLQRLSDAISPPLLVGMNDEREQHRAAARRQKDEAAPPCRATHPSDASSSRQEEKGWATDVASVLGGRGVRSPPHPYAQTSHTSTPPPPTRPVTPSSSSTTTTTTTGAKCSATTPTYGYVAGSRRQCIALILRLRDNGARRALRRAGVGVLHELRQRAAGEATTGGLHGDTSPPPSYASCGLLEAACQRLLREEEDAEEQQQQMEPAAEQPSTKKKTYRGGLDILAMQRPLRLSPSSTLGTCLDLYDPTNIACRGAPPSSSSRYRYTTFPGGYRESFAPLGLTDWECMRHHVQQQLFPSWAPGEKEANEAKGEAGAGAKEKFFSLGDEMHANTTSTTRRRETTSMQELRALDWLPPPPGGMRQVVRERVRRRSQEKAMDLVPGEEFEAFQQQMNQYQKTVSPTASPLPLSDPVVCSYAELEWSQRAQDVLWYVGELPNSALHTALFRGGRRQDILTHRRRRGDRAGCCHPPSPASFVSPSRRMEDEMSDAFAGDEGVVQVRHVYLYVGPDDEGEGDFWPSSPQQWFQSSATTPIHSSASTFSQDTTEKKRRDSLPSATWLPLEPFLLPIAPLADDGVHSAVVTGGMAPEYFRIQFPLLEMLSGGAATFTTGGATSASVVLHSTHACAATGVRPLPPPRPPRPPEVEAGAPAQAALGSMLPFLHPLIAVLLRLSHGLRGETNGWLLQYLRRTRVGVASVVVPTVQPLRRVAATQRRTEKKEKEESSQRPPPMSSSPTTRESWLLWGATLRTLCEISRYYPVVVHAPPASTALSPPPPSSSLPTYHHVKQMRAFPYFNVVPHHPLHTALLFPILYGTAELRHALHYLRGRLFSASSPALTRGRRRRRGRGSSISLKSPLPPPPPPLMASSIWWCGSEPPFPPPLGHLAALLLLLLGAWWVLAKTAMAVRLVCWQAAEMATRIHAGLAQPNRQGPPHKFLISILFYSIIRLRICRWVYKYIYIYIYIYIASGLSSISVSRASLWYLSLHGIVHFIAIGSRSTFPAPLVLLLVFYKHIHTFIHTYIHTACTAVSLFFHAADLPFNRSPLAKNKTTTTNKQKTGDRHRGSYLDFSPHSSQYILTPQNKQTNKQTNLTTPKTRRVMPMSPSVLSRGGSQQDRTTALPLALNFLTTSYSSSSNSGDGGGGGHGEKEMEPLQQNSRSTATTLNQKGVVRDLFHMDVSAHEGGPGKPSPPLTPVRSSSAYLYDPPPPRPPPSSRRHRRWGSILLLLISILLLSVCGVLVILLSLSVSAVIHHLYSQAAGVPLFHYILLWLVFFAASRSLLPLVVLQPSEKRAVQLCFCFIFSFCGLLLYVVLSDLFGSSSWYGGWDQGATEAWVQPNPAGDGADGGGRSSQKGLGMESWSDLWHSWLRGWIGWRPETMTATTSTCTSTSSSSPSTPAHRWWSRLAFGIHYWLPTSPDRTHPAVAAESADTRFSSIRRAGGCGLWEEEAKSTWLVPQPIRVFSLSLTVVLWLALAVSPMLCCYFTVLHRLVVLITTTYRISSAPSPASCDTVHTLQVPSARGSSSFVRGGIDILHSWWRGHPPHPSSRSSSPTSDLRVCDEGGLDTAATSPDDQDTNADRNETEATSIGFFAGLWNVRNRRAATAASNHHRTDQRRALTSDVAGATSPPWPPELLPSPSLPSPHAAAAAAVPAIPPPMSAEAGAKSPPHGRTGSLKCSWRNVLAAAPETVASGVGSTPPGRSTSAKLLAEGNSSASLLFAPGKRKGGGGGGGGGAGVLHFRRRQHHRCFGAYFACWVEEAVLPAAGRPALLRLSPKSHQSRGAWAAQMVPGAGPGVCDATAGGQYQAGVDAPMSIQYPSDPSARLFAVAEADEWDRWKWFDTGGTAAFAFGAYSAKPEETKPPPPSPYCRSSTHAEAVGPVPRGIDKKGDNGTPSEKKESRVGREAASSKGGWRWRWWPPGFVHRDRMEAGAPPTADGGKEEEKKKGLAGPSHDTLPNTGRQGEVDDTAKTGEADNNNNDNGDGGDPLGPPAPSPPPSVAARHRADRWWWETCQVLLWESVTSLKRTLHALVSYLGHMPGDHTHSAGIEGYRGDGETDLAVHDDTNTDATASPSSFFPPGSTAQNTVSTTTRGEGKEAGLDWGAEEAADAHPFEGSYRKAPEKNTIHQDEPSREGENDHGADAEGQEEAEEKHRSHDLGDNSESREGGRKVPSVPVEEEQVETAADAHREEPLTPPPDAKTSTKARQTTEEADTNAEGGLQQHPRADPAPSRPPHADKLDGRRCRGLHRVLLLVTAHTATMGVSLAGALSGYAAVTTPRDFIRPYWLHRRMHPIANTTTAQCRRRRRAKIRICRCDHRPPHDSAPSSCSLRCGTGGESGGGVWERYLPAGGRWIRPFCSSLCTGTRASSSPSVSTLAFSTPSGHLDATDTTFGRAPPLLWCARCGGIRDPDPPPAASACHAFVPQWCLNAWSAWRHPSVVRRRSTSLRRRWPRWCRRVKGLLSSLAAFPSVEDGSEAEETNGDGQEQQKVDVDVSERDDEGDEESDDADTCTPERGGSPQPAADAPVRRSLHEGEARVRRVLEQWGAEQWGLLRQYAESRRRAALRELELKRREEEAAEDEEALKTAQEKDWGEEEEEEEEEEDIVVVVDDGPPTSKGRGIIPSLTVTGMSSEDCVDLPAPSCHFPVRQHVSLHRLGSSTKAVPPSCPPKHSNSNSNSNSSKGGDDACGRQRSSPYYDTRSASCGAPQQPAPVLLSPPAASTRAPLAGASPASYPPMTCDLLHPSDLPLARRGAAGWRRSYVRVPSGSGAATESRGEREGRHVSPPSSPVVQCRAYTPSGGTSGGRLRRRPPPARRQQHNFIDVETMRVLEQVEFDAFRSRLSDVTVRLSQLNALYTQASTRSAHQRLFRRPQLTKAPIPAAMTPTAYSGLQSPVRNTFTPADDAWPTTSGAPPFGRTPQSPLMPVPYPPPCIPTTAMRGSRPMDCRTTFQAFSGASCAPLDPRGHEVWQSSASPAPQPPGDPPRMYWSTSAGHAATGTYEECRGRPPPPPSYSNTPATTAIGARVILGAASPTRTAAAVSGTATPARHPFTTTTAGDASGVAHRRSGSAICLIPRLPPTAVRLRHRLTDYWQTRAPVWERQVLAVSLWLNMLCGALLGLCAAFQLLLTLNRVLGWTTGSEMKDGALPLSGGGGRTAAAAAAVAPTVSPPHNETFAYISEHLVDLQFALMLLSGWRVAGSVRGLLVFIFGATRRMRRFFTSDTCTLLLATLAAVYVIGQLVCARQSILDMCSARAGAAAAAERKKRRGKSPLLPLTVAQEMGSEGVEMGGSASVWCGAARYHPTGSGTVASAPSSYLLLDAFQSLPYQHYVTLFDYCFTASLLGMLIFWAFFDPTVDPFDIHVPDKNPRPPLSPRKPSETTLEASAAAAMGGPAWLGRGGDDPLPLIGSAGRFEAAVLVRSSSSGRGIRADAEETAEEEEETVVQASSQSSPPPFFFIFFVEAVK
eukprot:gene2184-1352_t